MDLFDSTFFSQGDDVLVSPDNTMIFANDVPASSWTSINQGQASSTGTVSPTELSLEPSLTMSAPSSTAFPNLSTPGSNLLDSPWAHNSSSLDTSPLHPDGHLDSGLDGADWAGQPLFSNDPTLDPFAQTQVSKDITSEFTESSPMVRQKSSPGRPVGSGRKHSDVAGVKPSKARKPLPEIIIDENEDKDVAKRKKNTAAARKSRERKLERAQEQDAEIARLSDLISLHEQNSEQQHARIEKLQRYIIAMGGSPEQADLV